MYFILSWGKIGNECVYTYKAIILVYGSTNFNFEIATTVVSLPFCENPIQSKCSTNTSIIYIYIL